MIVCFSSFVAVWLERKMHGVWPEWAIQGAATFVARILYHARPRMQVVMESSTCLDYVAGGIN